MIWGARPPGDDGASESACRQHSNMPVLAALFCSALCCCTSHRGYWSEAWSSAPQHEPEGSLGLEAAATVQGCGGQGGVQWQRTHCWGSTYPREEGRGATAPLAHLPGKFAWTGKVNPSCHSLSPHFCMLYLRAFGVIWPRQAWFHHEEAAGGWAGKELDAGGIWDKQSN